MACKRSNIRKLDDCKRYAKLNAASTHFVLVSSTPAHLAAENKFISAPLHACSMEIIGRKGGNIAACLVKFKSLVQAQATCKHLYEPWPPKTSRLINFKSPLARGILVYNRKLENGQFEPTLVITGLNKRPCLMLNQGEFNALVQQLEWIKLQLESFYKLL